MEDPVSTLMTSIGSATRLCNQNPRTATVVLGAVTVVACPALATTAIYYGAGLTAMGPTAGGPFALMQALVGTPAAAATLQSAAMGGYGAAIVNGLVQSGAALAGLSAAAKAGSTS